MSGNYCKRFSVGGGVSNGSHFLDNCPHCPGHDAYGVIFYIFLPDHTEVKYGEELLGQQSVNKSLMSSYYVQDFVQDGCPHSPSHICPPQPLPVTSHHPSVLCPGLLPSPGNHRPSLSIYSLHYIMHPLKRRDSELFPPRNREGFETGSEELNSLLKVLLQVIGEHQAPNTLKAHWPLTPPPSWTHWA